MTASRTHLLGRLAAVESKLRALVELRRHGDPDPDDAFRGLYLSDAAVDRLLLGPPAALPEQPSVRLAELEREADEAEARGEPVRLRELARTFALDDLDVELLLVAMACELDPRLEQLFGYLNDDVTRRRPSVSVALTLAGGTLASPEDRAHLLHGPVVLGRLLDVLDVERPFPGRALSAPDRVVQHLLGDDAPDPALAPVLAPAPDLTWGDPGPLARAVQGGARLVYLREPATGSGVVLAVEVLRRAGRAPVVVDLTALAAEHDPLAAVALVVREVRLRRGGLVVGPVERESASTRVLRALQADPCPVLLVGACPWEPTWNALPPLVVDVPASTPAERERLWCAALQRGDGGTRAPAVTADGLDVGSATAQFLLRPEQVARAAQAATEQVRLSADGRLTAAHVRAGARGENGSALDRLARRVEPGVGWADLVLPPSTLTALQELALRARYREQVLGSWRMRPGGGRGRGVAGLFAGDSGTGKTMSAEVLAGELGLDLYVVDLATVVDKYVGETEKNLERIFSAAAGVNGVLLFDEADAVFGKRSEVRDAHDRYANIESAYLLQRLESFDGLAVLATNLRANIDEAFTRRLDVVVDFPLPDVEHRLALWERSLSPAVPRSDDLDLRFCAAAFDLAGGAIRSASVTAAYQAAADGGVLTMAHVMTGVQREYRKLGRLCLPSEFGRYHALLT